MCESEGNECGRPVADRKALDAANSSAVNNMKEVTKWYEAVG